MSARHPLRPMGAWRGHDSGNPRILLSLAGSRPAVGERWDSRLVATTEEDRLSDARCSERRSDARALSFLFWAYRLHSVRDCSKIHIAARHNGGHVCNRGRISLQPHGPITSSGPASPRGFSLLTNVSGQPQAGRSGEGRQPTRPTKAGNSPIL